MADSEALAEKISREVGEAYRRAGIVPTNAGGKHSVMSIYRPEVDTNGATKKQTMSVSDFLYQPPPVRRGPTLVINDEAKTTTPVPVRGRGIDLTNNNSQPKAIDEIIPFTLPDGKSLCEFLQRYYRIHAKTELSRGASSKVYKLTIGDTEYLIRETKLKNDQIAYSKFREECNILHALRNSPYVMTIFGACRIREVGYMLLESVPGRTMLEWLKEDGTKSDAERIRVYQQLLHGLKSIHAHGIVHLDIKPANIWIPFSHDRPAFFLDFDLARPATSPVTAELGASGTKEYMPSGGLENLLKRNYWALGRVIGEFNDISNPSGLSGTNYGKIVHKNPEMRTPVGSVVKHLQESERHTPDNFNLLIQTLEPVRSNAARVGGGAATAASSTRRARRAKKLTRRSRRA